MQLVSIGRWAQRHWMVLFAVLVIAVAGSAVFQLNGIFGSQDVASTPSNAWTQAFPVSGR